MKKQTKILIWGLFLVVIYSGLVTFYALRMNSSDFRVFDLVMFLVSGYFLGCGIDQIEKSMK